VIELRSLAEAKDFSLASVSSSEVHPASYPVGTVSPLPGGRAWPGHEADLTPPSSAKVKD
jgi:hypothetical protein